MPIRRLQYQIDCIHILTFKEEYRNAVIPYFGFENLEYGIDNENTILETIRLIFKNENMAIILRKEGVAIVYEGDCNDLKNQNGVVKIFWELYDKMKMFKGFRRVTKHVLITHAVDIKPKEEVSVMLEKNPYLSMNPFGKLSEFACIYEFDKENIHHVFQFGNFSQRDIKTHELMLLKSKFNEELIGNTGVMGRLELVEHETSPTFSKFKSLLSTSEKVYRSFDFVLNEKN